MPYEKFGEILNKYLNQKDRSAAWLGNELGIHRGTVTRWLKGETRPNSPELAGRIAVRLGIVDSEERQRFFASVGYAYQEGVIEEQFSHATLLDFSPYDYTAKEVLKQLEKVVGEELVRARFQGELIDVKIEFTDRYLVDPTKSKRLFEIQNQVLSIHSVFELCHKRLLILGGPGIGKTLVLHQLAEALLENTTHFFPKIPVILRLNTFGSDQDNVADWLVSALQKTYFVSRSIARSWVEEEKLILLLDGLDTITESQQANSIVRLNKYFENHSYPFAITCRTTELQRTDKNVCAEAAIILQRLRNDQVQDYFERVNLEPHLSKLLLESKLLSNEETKTPLMLQTMIQTFGGIPEDDLPLISGLSYHQLFEKFVERKLAEHREAVITDSQIKANRQRAEILASEKQSLSTLQWLAAQMIKHNVTDLYIERLQPKWLTNKGFLAVYFLLSRFLIGLVGGLIGGIMLGLGLGLFFNLLNEGFLRGIVEGTICGVTGGMTIGLIDLIRVNRILIEGDIKLPSSQLYARIVAKITLRTVAVGLNCWVMIWMCLGRVNWLGYDQIFWQREGVFVAICAGLCFGFVFGFRTRMLESHKALSASELLYNDIETVESYDINPAGAWAGITYGIIVGTISSSTYLYFQDLSWPLTLAFPGWRLIAVSILVCSFVAGIFGGITGPTVDIPDDTVQGIWSSVKKSLRYGAVISLVCTIVGLAIGMLGSVTNIQVLTFGTYGLFVGVLSLLWYGGIDLIKHAILRILLVWSEGAPFNFYQHLEFGVKRAFINRSLGGYHFMHELLKLHFAERSN